MGDLKMVGQMRGAIDRAYWDLWQPLTEHEDFVEGTFAEIYIGLSKHLRRPEPMFVQDDDGTVRDVTPRIEYQAALAMSDPSFAETLLQELDSQSFETESSAVAAIASAFDVLDDIGSETLAVEYLQLLQIFIQRYGLQYYVDDKCRVWRTFPGLAADVFGEISRVAAGKPHLRSELGAFEHALAECLLDPQEVRIKTVIQKQINVLEALGADHSSVSGNTLGRMCDEVGSWPHQSVPDAAKSLYKFACDYPGIRHGGTYASALRPLDLRDLGGVSMALLGMASYLLERTASDATLLLTGHDGGVGRPDWVKPPWVSDPL